MNWSITKKVLSYIEIVYPYSLLILTKGAEGGIPSTSLNKIIMTEPKDYVHLEMHIGHKDDTKMTAEEMSKLHLEVVDFLVAKDYKIFGGVGLKDDEELFEELNYGDERLDEESAKYAAIPEEGPDVIDYFVRKAFLAGAKFVRSIVDARYRK